MTAFVAALLAGVVAGLCPNGSAAHHSYAEFDLTRSETVRGTVVAFDWINPHVLVRIAVDREGTRVVWQLEGMNPAYLGRRGWSRTTLLAGDSVELDYYPLRNGGRGGTVIRARLSDGTLKVMINPADGEGAGR